MIILNCGSKIEEEKISISKRMSSVLNYKGYENKTIKYFSSNIEKLEICYPETLNIKTEDKAYMRDFFNKDKNKEYVCSSQPFYGIYVKKETSWVGFPCTVEYADLLEYLILWSPDV